jgi:S1-C subfamily serine protease
MALASGASGGPVAFGEGAVFGVNSTGFDGSALSYISPVSAILDLSIGNIRFADGTIRENVKVSELVDRGLVVFSADR